MHGRVQLPNLAVQQLTAASALVDLTRTDHVLKSDQVMYMWPSNFVLASWITINPGQFSMRQLLDSI